MANKLAVRFVVWGICLGWLAPAGAFGIRDRQAVDNGQCRLSFGRSVRALSVAMAFDAGVCHRDRLRGKIDSSIDCNDPWSWQAAGYARGSKRALSKIARFHKESKHCTAGVVETSTVGYDIPCPAPCAGLPTATFAEVGVCLECVLQDGVRTGLGAILGSPEAPATRDGKKCQTAMGRGVARYLHKRMKLQNTCEFKKDVGVEEFATIDCTDIGTEGHPFAHRNNRMRASIASQISRRCAAVDQLDGCADDAAGAAECVPAIVESWADTVHPAAWPPLP